MRAFFLAACLLLVAGPVAAADIETGAALRQTSLLLHWPTEAPLPTGSFGLLDTRLRPYATLHASDRLSFGAAIEARSSFESGSAPSPGLQGSLLGSSMPLRYLPWTWTLIDDNATGASLSVERADVLWRIGRVDVQAGRQPVSFGTSHFVGVVDVIAPFAPGDLDSSYKPGVDALRIRTGMGTAGEAEIIAVAAKPMRDGAAIARLRRSLGGMDVEVLGGRFRRRNFGGVSWEGDVPLVSVWGEAALFERKNEPVRGGGKKTAIEAVAGVERHLPGDALLGVGAYYNEFGTRKTGDLLPTRLDAPFVEGWVFLAERAYGVVTGQWQIHPLVTLAGAGIVSLVDASSLWQPRCTVSVSDNADLAVFGWIGAGPRPRLSSAGLRTPSEFGTVPDGGGLYARWFF
jgi:hypothetical protein